MIPQLAVTAFVITLPTTLAAALQSTDDIFGAARIIGGEPAAAGEFPYIISLSSQFGFICGGVLLNENTVVTAAHCTDGWEDWPLTVRADSLVC
jgi:trypsin